MDQLPSPGLLRRLAAIIYDTLLVLPIIMATVAAATGIAVAISGDPGNDDYSATLPPWLVQLLALAAVMGFFGYFWRQKGQTLGMQAWRIRIRSFDAERMSSRQVVIRCLGALVSALPAGLGYLWCVVDRNGRYWHDYLSKTELELLPKRDKSKDVD